MNTLDELAIRRIATFSKPAAVIDWPDPLDRCRVSRAGRRDRAHHRAGDRSR